MAKSTRTNTAVDASRPEPHRDEQGRYAKRPPPSDLHDETTGEQVHGGGAGGSGVAYERGGGPYGMIGMGNWPASVEGGPAFLFANGGSLANPMGFPGYGSMYTGTYGVYRFMLQNEWVSLVLAIATADILCNKWEYVAVNPIGKRFKNLVRDQLDPLRMPLMEDFFMGGRNMGWQGGELIWARKGLYQWLTRVKPLLVDVTRCLRDDSGDFTGLLNEIPNKVVGQTKPDVRIAAPYKAWKYTYRGEAGYMYGRSWLENIRMFSFRDLLDCMQQLQKLSGKITGIQIVITHPAGTFPSLKSDGTTQQVSYADFADKMIKALASGSPGIRLPSLALPIQGINKIDTAKAFAELAQKSMIKCDLLNHGTNAPAIEGILNRMKQAIQGIFAGGMRPAATGMQGEGKANTEQHNDTSSKVSQLEDQDFARQCQPLVDAILVLNGGEQARGSVRIMPPSIVDNKRAYIKAFLLAALNDPEIAMEMLRAIAVNEELANLDIRTTDAGFSVERIEKRQEKQQKMQLQAKQQAAAGNGNGKGSTKAPTGGRPNKGNGQPLKRPQPSRSASLNGNGRHVAAN